MIRCPSSPLLPNLSRLACIVRQCRHAFVLSSVLSLSSFSQKFSISVPFPGPSVPPTRKKKKPRGEERKEGRAPSAFCSSAKLIRISPQKSFTGGSRGRGYKKAAMGAQ